MFIIIIRMRLTRRPSALKRLGSVSEQLEHGKRRYSLTEEAPGCLLRGGGWLVRGGGWLVDACCVVVDGWCVVVDGWYVVVNGGWMARLERVTENLNCKP